MWDGLKAAYELTEALSKKTGGLLWDEETREVFSPTAWDESRLGDWPETGPDISRHTVIHAYQSGEYIRAITLGMAKFGLPDVVVDGFSWSLNQSMGNVVNLFCQAIAEKGELEIEGQFDLVIDDIKHEKIRTAMLESLKTNATKTARLSLVDGRWEEGDPDNPLIEITFDRYSGNDVHARQDLMLGGLFGFEDSITPVRESEKLTAASQKARTKLPGLRADFVSGLEPGEYIMLKAPFGTSNDGTEWMWVEVSSWKGDDIEGVLKNEPFDVPELHAGQIVKISESDVFDYLRVLPDGSAEGNETGNVIDAQDQE